MEHLLDAEQVQVLPGLTPLSLPLPWDSFDSLAARELGKYLDVISIKL